ncbi:MAG: COR domain-containing protein [Bacteroidia bacterium]|nr:COR domain-containing protein [Bacteroidia bacterium]
MEKPALLQAAEQALGYSFEKVLYIHSYFNSEYIYPDSYRAVMTWQQEMVRDGHGGTAFIDSEGRLLGINLYAETLDPAGIQRLLALGLPDLLALNLNQTGVDRFAFTARQPQLMYVNLSQNAALTELRFDYCPAQLRILDLYDSRVQALDLPAGLDALYRLDAARNKNLARLTFGGPCPQLWFLDLSENQLRELDFPAGFPALQYLFLRKNQLAKLEFGGRMEGLETLDVRENQLRELPDQFLDRAPNATHLFLYNNPWDSIRDAVSAEEKGNSRDSIFSFLESLRGPVDYLLEAKLILVGNGEVGKTSIRRKLINEQAPLPRKEERTPAIEVEPYVVKNLPSTFTQLPDERDFTFNIWDFGGQGRYREIQQIFCSQKSLYLFVTSWDDQPEQKKALEDYVSFEYWLDMVTAYGHDPEQAQSSPVLVVINKTEDEQYADVEKTSLRKSYPHIHAQEIYTSCLTLRGFQDLRSAIRSLIPRISPDIFTTRRNSKWLNVKQLLEGRRKEKKITYADYEALCLKEGLSEQDARTWIGMLDRIGAVIYFGQHPKLKDLIVLDPEWVREAVVHVLDSKLLRKGVLSPDMFDSIWPAYSEADRAAFLELMLAYKLCYTRQDAFGELEYLVPACLPAQAPPLPDFLRQPDFDVRIGYKPFVPAGTVNKLIVTVQRLRQPLEMPETAEGTEKIPRFLATQGISVYDNLMWKNTAIFHDPRHNAYAQVQENWDEKRIDIRLFGQQVRPLYETLEALLQELNDELKATRYIRGLEVEAKGLDGSKWVDMNYLREKRQFFFNESMNPSREIQDHIAAGRIEQALKSLAQQLPAGHRNEAISLQGRFARLQTDIIRGTKTTAEINVERNQIVSAILQLAKLLDEQYSNSGPLDKPTTPVPPYPDSSAKPILFLAANPANETRIQTDKEHRELKAEFERGAAGRSRYTFLQPQFAVTIGELQRALDARPAIIHFSGHGLEDGIIISNEQNQAQLLGEPALRRIFNRAKDHTELLLLNACFSAVQAQIISGFGIYVVGANRAVQDDACVQFSKAFYSALGRGKSYQDAYDEAITAVSVHHPTEEAKFEAWHNGKKLDW